MINYKMAKFDKNFKFKKKTLNFEILANFDYFIIGHKIILILFKKKVIIISF